MSIGLISPTVAVAVAVAIAVIMERATETTQALHVLIPV